MSRKSFNAFSLVACLCFVTTIAFSGWALTRTSALSTRNCVAIERVKTEIRATLAQSLKTLGKPSYAGFAYFHNHPTELANAVAATKATIVSFAPLPC